MRLHCVVLDSSSSGSWEGEPLQFGEMDVEGVASAPPASAAVGAGAAVAAAAVSAPVAMKQQRRRLWSQAETPSSLPALHEPDTGDCDCEGSSLPMQVRLLSSPLLFSSLPIHSTSLHFSPVQL